MEQVNQNDKKLYTAKIGDEVIEEWNYEIFISKISMAKKTLEENVQKKEQYLKG